MSAISICHLDWGNELLLSLQPLWKDATLCDTTIECKQKQIIQAHSILLAAASPKLYSYFRMVEQGSYTLVTHDVPVSVWRNILSFIYHGRLEVSEDELVPTYNFARKIEMNQFSRRLGEEIKQRGLCMEQQEAFLRAFNSPRGQVKSPKSPSSAGSRPSTVSPRLPVASPQGPQGQMVSPQGQMSMTQSQMMAYQRQMSSPHGIAVTPPVHTDASSDLNPLVSATSPLTSHSNRSTPPFSNQQPSSRKPPQPTPTPPQPTTLEPVPAQTQPQMSMPTQRKVTSQRERYECAVCLQSFNRESVLRKHEGECKVVTQAQSSIVSYRNFYTRIESSEGGDETTSFKCDLCEKSFGTYQGLYNHLRTKHTNQVQAVTQPNTRHFKPGELMGKGSNSGANTRRGGSQLLNKSASCPICKKQFKTYAQMLSHKNTHKKPASTRQPSSASGDASEPTTSGESKMEEGTPVATPPPQSVGDFLCNVCGRSFKKKMHLGNHMNTHNK